MNEIISTETTAEDSWDDMDFSDTLVEDDTVDEGSETVGNPETDQPEEEIADQQNTEPGEEEQEQEITLTLNYLGEAKTVSKEEAVTLAQKGMDYDRIRTKNEELLTENQKFAEDMPRLKEQLAVFEDIATARGMTIDEFVDDIMAERLVAQQGIDKTVALGRVQLDRERKQLQAEKGQRQESPTGNGEQERRAADINAFKVAFPDVFTQFATDKNAIPESVWAEVSTGVSLVAAYAKYHSAQLQEKLNAAKAEAEQLKQKEINKSRSTGPQSSKGSSTPEDLIDLLWDES